MLNSLARTFTLIALAIALNGFSHPAIAEIRVVTSIKPIHSLVSGVMQGTGVPHLIVKGNASPHAYSLRPSDAEALQQAGLIFWVGPDLEPFLERSLASLAPTARQIALASAEGVVRLPVREGGAFEAEHEDDGHDHGEGEFDLHVWLDPVNAAAMVSAIEAALAAADPANGPVYAANAERLRTRIAGLGRAISAELAPLAGQPFIVFHDGYQYFEKRFGVVAAGSIVVNPDTAPGARRLSQIQARIRQLGVVCVFSEPQFNPRLIAIATDGTQARSAALDPLGADLADGPELYFTLLRNLAAAMRGCLTGS